MLTYYLYAPLLQTTRALLLTLISLFARLRIREKDCAIPSFLGPRTEDNQALLTAGVVVLVAVGGKLAAAAAGSFEARA